MSEEKSKCCGYEVYEELDEFYDEQFGDKISDEIIFICSGCGMSCEVEEKDHDEEWKNARDAYSGEREEE